MVEKLSKYRKELFGISAIAILLLHIGTYANLIPTTFIFGKVVLLVFEIGSYGVDIFLILSAIGLTYSIEKNSLARFYLNRIKRTFLPYLFFALFYFLWYDFFVAKDGIIQFILNTLSLNYFIVGPVFPLWFVPFILVMYLVFPILNAINNKSKVFTVFLIVFVIVLESFLLFAKSALYESYEIFISRIPVFLFGVILSKSKIGFSKKYNIILLPIGLVSLFAYYFLALPEMFNRYLLFIFAISLCAFYITIREHINLSALGKVFGFAGKYSLEIYVSHVLLIQIIKFYNLWSVVPSSLWYLIIPAVTLILSVFVSKTIEYIYRKV